MFNRILLAALDCIRGKRDLPDGMTKEALQKAFYHVLTALRGPDSDVGDDDARMEFKRKYTTPLRAWCFDMSSNMLSSLYPVSTGNEPPACHKGWLDLLTENETLLNSLLADQSADAQDKSFPEAAYETHRHFLKHAENGIGAIVTLERWYVQTLSDFDGGRDDRVEELDSDIATAEDDLQDLKDKRETLVNRDWQSMLQSDLFDLLDRE